METKESGGGVDSIEEIYHPPQPPTGRMTICSWGRRPARAIANPHLPGTRGLSREREQEQYHHSPVQHRESNHSQKQYQDRPVQHKESNPHKQNQYLDRPVQRGESFHQNQYHQAVPPKQVPRTYPTPKVQHQETPEADIFFAQLPYATNKNDINVQVEEGTNVLCVTGEKKEEKRETSVKPNQVVPCSGQFQQRFKLPDHSNLDAIEASWDNEGTLTVKIPKKIPSHGGYHNKQQIGHPSKPNVSIY